MNALYLLEKRTSRQLDKFTCDDSINIADIQFYRPAYPSSSDWDSADSITDEAIDNQDPVCTNTNVRLKTQTMTNSKNYNRESELPYQVYLMVIITDRL
jgi:hypothetical protein